MLARAVRPPKCGAHGDYIVLFRDILMDRIVRKTCERGSPAVDQSFDFVRGGVLLDAGKRCRRLVICLAFASQHSAL